MAERRDDDFEIWYDPDHEPYSNVHEWEPVDVRLVERITERRPPERDPDD